MPEVKPIELAACIMVAILAFVVGVTLAIWVQDLWTAYKG